MTVNPLARAPEDSLRRLQGVVGRTNEGHEGVHVVVVAEGQILEGHACFDGWASRSGYVRAVSKLPDAESVVGLGRLERLDVRNRFSLDVLDDGLGLSIGESVLEDVGVASVTAFEIESHS